MEIETLRRQLLQQHDELKRLITSAKRLSTQISNGDGVATRAKKLRAVLEELAAALEKHSEQEHSILEPVLRTIDAWGPERVARMHHDHRAERAAMNGALQSLTELPPKELASATREAVDELIAHLKDEEKHLLSGNVLTHDIMRPNQPTD